jgi:hypothetical protein
MTAPLWWALAVCAAAAAVAAHAPATAAARPRSLLVSITPDGPPQVVPFDPQLQPGSLDVPMDDPRASLAGRELGWSARL